MEAGDLHLVRVILRKGSPQHQARSTAHPPPWSRASTRSAVSPTMHLEAKPSCSTLHCSPAGRACGSTGGRGGAGRSGCAAAPAAARPRPAAPRRAPPAHSSGSPMGEARWSAACFGHSSRILTLRAAPPTERARSKTNESHRPTLQTLTRRRKCALSVVELRFKISPVESDANVYFPWWTLHPTNPKSKSLGFLGYSAFLFPRRYRLLFEGTVNSPRSATSGLNTPNPRQRLSSRDALRLAVSYSSVYIT